jgi:AraC family transcriptional regulator
MPKVFGHHRQYIDEVQDRTSDRLGWRGVRMTLTRETSNDLLFTRMLKNALTLELTGTSAHLTKMDGIVTERPTRPGDICQIPAGVSARFAWDVSDAEQRSIVVEFDDALLSIYCPERLEGRMRAGHLTPRDYTQAPSLAAIMKLLARELNPQHARGPIFADMLIRLLAIEICETAWTRKAPIFNSGLKADRRIVRAVDYIHAHLSAQISLGDLATASGLSINLLTKYFRRHTGSSPYAYVIGKRVEKAKHLLQSTKMPIAQVAVESGFADQAHLSKALRQHFGQTPRALRIGCRVPMPINDTTFPA